MSVQGIRDAQSVQSGPPSLRAQVAERFRPRGAFQVQQRQAGGQPQGFWPAALRGRLFGDVSSATTAKSGKRRSSSPSERVESAQVEEPQRFVPEPHSGEFTQVEFAETLYFDGGFDGSLPLWAQRFGAGIKRTSHHYTESQITPYSYGAELAWSGPSGTLVLFPLHMPRRMGNVNAIGRSTINRPSVARTGIPGVTVVQASGQYP